MYNCAEVQSNKYYFHNQFVNKLKRIFWSHGNDGVGATVLLNNLLEMPKQKKNPTSLT